MSNYYSKLVGRVVTDVSIISDDEVCIGFGNTMSEPPVDMIIDNTASIRPRDIVSTKNATIIRGDGSWQKRMDAGQCPRCNSSALTYIASPSGGGHKCRVCTLMIG